MEPGAGQDGRIAPTRSERPASRSRRLDPAVDAAILEATLQGLAEVGYDRMSVEEIAARARVGKAAIYRRWSSKPAIVADAIVYWRRGAGPVTAPDTGTLRGDLQALVSVVPSSAEMSTFQVVVGVATAATRDPVLAAALDDLVLSQPRQIIRTVLDRASARGEIPPGRDLSLVPDAVIGLNVLRLMTGRPLDRVFVRRVLEDVVLPLATAQPVLPGPDSLR
jgi:AcrR family transcriptional regulator